MSNNELHLPAQQQVSEEKKNALLPQVGIITDIRRETPDVKTFRIVRPDGTKLFEHMPGQCAMLCVPGVVVFACNGMLSVLTTLFLSNSVDYGQLKTGRREESVIFSMQTFVVKAASGVAVFLTGIGLDLIGLAGNAEETGPVAAQSAGTLLGLRFMMTVLPMLVLAGALVLFRRKFVLTDARAAEISAQLHGEETHHD